jgi:hypothetical protein
MTSSATQTEPNKERKMARFPRREADIATLASQMITGLTEHAEAFQSPPRSPEELQASLEAYVRQHEAAVLAKAAASEAYADKDEALQALTDDMKLVLSYAENTAKGDPEKLQALGWDARRDATSPQPPGQVLALEVKREGPGWLYLDWKKPSDGGLVAAYHVQLQKDGTGEWADISTCFDTLAVLTSQQRGVDLTYRVVAVNRYGEGLPSNTVTATL